MVGSARRSGPKLQARSAVSGADANLFEFDVLFDKGGSAAKVGRLGDPSLPLIFERRCRASREKGEWPSRPFMTVASKPHRFGTPKSHVGHASRLPSKKPTGLRPQIRPPPRGRARSPETRALLRVWRRLSGSSGLETKSHPVAEGGSGFCQGGQGERGRGGIQDPVQGGSARFHAVGELGFGNLLLIEDSLQLQGDRLFHGQCLDLGKDFFLCEKIPQGCAAVLVGMGWYLHGYASR
jgi:hypothetical protein